MARALTIGLLALTLLASVVFFGAHLTKDQERKNVILVVVDTMRADRASLYGYERETTPELSKWAKGGAVFERAFSASSWTVPSMAMLLTGRYRVGGGIGVDDTSELLSSALSAEGYRTVAIVANPVLNELQGFVSGYESYDLIDGRQDMSDPLHPGSWTAPFVIEKALTWLRNERDERPFMLYLHLMDPHYPYEPDRLDAFDGQSSRSKKRRKAYDDALDLTNDAHLSEDEYTNLERQQAAYDAEILQVDAGLGELFRYLEASGLAQNSIVLLTADHGEGLWQRPSGDGWINQGLLEGQLASKLYRGHGEHLFNELIHVPLALSGPGVPEGLRMKQPVSLVDVVPTLLSLLDLSPTEGLHGKPLFDPEGNRDVYSDCSRGSSIIEDGRWKLHLPNARSLAKGAVTQLFDLEADPLEQRPIKDAAIRARLVQKLEAWAVRHRRDIRSRSLEEQRQLLLQMGYAGLAEDLSEEMSLEEKQQAMKQERERRRAEANAKD
jgi:arylsulfatase A-like enzyme